jgi:hypothetical protein
MCCHRADSGREMGKIYAAIVYILYASMIKQKKSRVTFPLHKGLETRLDVSIYMLRVSSIFSLRVACVDIATSSSVFWHRLRCSAASGAFASVVPLAFSFLER